MADEFGFHVVAADESVDSVQKQIRKELRCVLADEKLHSGII
jgi:hypothetical protein